MASIAGKFRWVQSKESLAKHSSVFCWDLEQFPISSACGARLQTPPAPARERQKSCLSIAGVPDGLELLVQGLKEVLFKRMLLTLRNAMTTHVFNRANTRLSSPSSLPVLTDFSLLEELLPAYLPKDNHSF